MATIIDRLSVLEKNQETLLAWASEISVKSLVEMKRNIEFLLKEFGHPGASAIVPFLAEAKVREKMDRDVMRGFLGDTFKNVEERSISSILNNLSNNKEFISSLTDWEKGTPNSSPDRPRWQSRACEILKRMAYDGLLEKVCGQHRYKATDELIQKLAS